MANGQKRSNRETRKPKQDKPKPAAAPCSFLDFTKGPARPVLKDWDGEPGFLVAQRHADRG